VQRRLQASSLIIRTKQCFMCVISGDVGKAGD
jgi:hypothetical protein